MNKRERVAAAIYNSTARHAGRIVGWSEDWPGGEFREQVLEIADAAIKAVEDDSYDPAIALARRYRCVPGRDFPDT